MTDHPNDTSIALDPDVPIIRITREFEAPAASVFRAHIEPDLVVRWLGPRRHEMRLDRWEPSTGGAYRYVHASDGHEHWFHGSFHEVRPADGVIVQTFTYEGMPDSVFLERFAIEDLPDGRCRLTAMSLIDSFAARDALMASGMEGGVEEGYERLDEVLVDEGAAHR